MNDPDRLYDAFLSAGVSPSSMPELFRAMKLWHCRCCTLLHSKDVLVCPRCDTPRGNAVFDAREGRKSPPRASSSSSMDTAIGYDPRMMEHAERAPSNVFDLHPERPDRIEVIYQQLQIDGLIQRCIQFPSHAATQMELLHCHEEMHCSTLEQILHQYPDGYHVNGDTYTLGRKTKIASELAAGIVIDLAKRVLAGECRNAFAIVRPPGHHAEPDSAMGFCLYNNVALAAQVAKQAFPEICQRVLIVDWDIHHGNGTEHMFENDPSVMYCSLHRFERAEFYPGTGPASSIGSGPGRGYTVNIAWPHGHMRDIEYLTAFSHVLMPIFREFSPDLVLVSAGFDSAQGDPLGGCEVTPAGYAAMTSSLRSLANGKLVLALEGGYNLHSIAHSASACVQTLLAHTHEEAPPNPGKTLTPDSTDPRLARIYPGARAAMAQTRRALAPYWSCLRTCPTLRSSSLNNNNNPRVLAHECARQKRQKLVGFKVRIWRWYSRRRLERARARQRAQARMRHSQEDSTWPHPRVFN